MAKQTIEVEGTTITIFQHKEKDYVSLTDMARKFNERTDVVIQRWMRNRNTIEYLELWERMYNPNFNPTIWMGLKKNCP